MEWKDKGGGEKYSQKSQCPHLGTSNTRTKTKRGRKRRKTQREKSR